MTATRITDNGLAELKSAFQQLMGVYITAIETITNQPFFVNPRNLGNSPNPHRLHNKPGTYREKIQGWMFSLLNTRPLVRLYVESHIKSKLGEFDIIFTQLLIVIPTNKSKVRSWLTEQREQIRETRQTLQSWQSLRASIYLVITFLFGLLLQLLGGDAIRAFFSGLLNNISAGIYRTVLVQNEMYRLQLSLLSLLTYSTIPLFSFIFSFVTKREIFLSPYADGGKTNIYTVEDSFFALLGRRKTREFPLVMFITSAFLFLWLLLIGLGYWPPYATIMNYSTDFLGAVSYWFMHVFFQWVIWSPWRKALPGNVFG